MRAAGRTKRAVAIAAALACVLVFSGCATVGPYSAAGLAKRGDDTDNPEASVRRRGRARIALIAVGSVAVAASVLGGVMGYRTKSSLEDDLAAGAVSGRELVDRDAEGQRWNRLTRTSIFAAGLAGLGLGILWEMGTGERMMTGPREPTPADDKALIFPVPAN